MTWAHLRRWVWSDVTLWSTPEVRRVFMRCDRCRKVVPLWRMCGRLPMRVGCSCGCVKTWAANVPEWKAAYWLLVRGWLIRRVLLRREVWDPRMPLREGSVPQ